MENEKEYMAIYKTQYGTLERGVVIPYSTTTLDIHYFKAKDDQEAIKVADSYETRRDIIAGRFTEKLPNLERLAEIRDLELPKK